MSEAADHRPRLRWPVVVSLVAMIAAGCTTDASPEGPQSVSAAESPSSLTFHRPSTVLDDVRAGEVLDTKAVAIDPSWPGSGSRITFVSTTPAGDHVPVTGMVLRPDRPPPAGGYPVVVWGHGSVGLGDPCAPSRAEPFEAVGAKDFLDAGYMVVAPDYEGLGVEGETHPYLVGLATGYNLLDAARVGAASGGGGAVVIFGASQGGHAALFSRQVAPDYAPDVHVLGVVAAAPVTDPGLFLDAGRTDPDVFPFTAEAILAWSEVYEEPELTDVVVVKDAEAVRLAREEWCTESLAPPRPLDEIFLEDPDDEPVWRAAVDENRPRAEDMSIPVLLTHGDADGLVPIAGTVDFHGALCRAGEDVLFLRSADWVHASAWTAPLPDIVTWIADRFAGTPAPTDCR